MEKDRSIAERRDVIIRKVLEDMFALQRKRLGIVGAKLVACVARPPNESGRRPPKHVAHHAWSQIGSAAPLSENEMKGIVTPARKYHDIRTTQNERGDHNGQQSQRSEPRCAPSSAEFVGRERWTDCIPGAGRARTRQYRYRYPARARSPAACRIRATGLRRSAACRICAASLRRAPAVVAYPAPVYGGVSLGFGWHDGGRHHWRR
jgi:hypothetical protein